MGLLLLNDPGGDQDWGGIDQRRTKNGVGRQKTVPVGTGKTQRMEAAGAVSAIVSGVRFFFISLVCLE
jgi:ABC-type molybdate transport system substrate-binding protein